MKNIRFKIRYLIGLTLLLPMLLLALLQTPLGKRILATTLSRALTSPARSVHISGISGWMPHRICVDSLDVGDADGVWLSFADFECRWLMRDLFNGKIHIQKLTAAEIAVARRPAAGKAKPVSSPSRAAFRPLGVQLDGLQIGRLLLGETVAGTALELALHSTGISMRKTGEFAGDLVVSGDVEGQGKWTGGLLAKEPLELAVELRQLHKPIYGLNQFSGKLEATLDPKSLTLHSLNCRILDMADISLAGRIGADELAANGSLSSLDVSRLPWGSCSNMTGNVSATMMIGGSLAQPKLSAQLRVENFTSSKSPFNKLPELDLQVNGGWNDGVLSASTTVSNGRVENLSAEGQVPCEFSLAPVVFNPQVSDISGRMITRMDLSDLHLGNTGEITTSLTIKKGATAGVTQISGLVSTSGEGAGAVELSAVLDRQFSEGARLLADFKESQKPPFGLDLFSGNLDALYGPEGFICSLSSLFSRGEQSGQLATRLQCRNRGLQWELSQFKGFNCGATGDLSLHFSPQSVDLQLKGLFADANENQYSLSGEVSADLPHKAVDLGTFKLGINDLETVSISGKFSPEQIDLNGVVFALPLNMLPWDLCTDLRGEAAGKMTVRGSATQPQIEMMFGIDKLRSTSVSLNEMADLTLELNGGWKEGVLSATTSVSSQDGEILSSVVQLPAELSLMPFVFTPRPKIVSGNLNGQLDLAILNRIPALSSQWVEGHLTAALKMEQGVPAGLCQLTKGRYENYELGLLVRDAEVEIEVSKDGGLIRHASASDGGAGTLALTGSFDWQNINLQLDLAGAKIIQRPEIAAKMSGMLKMTGSTRRPDITGKLTIDRANVLPDNIVSGKPEVLTDFDADAPIVSAAVPVGNKPLPVGLDLLIDIPDMLYVNAALIDSIWGGQLKVRDTEKGVAIDGAIMPRRGYVSFLGKKFRFEDGSIEFDGNVPVSPLMNNLTAEYTSRDITAQLVLNGRAVAPTFTMTSSPALPQDEIISRILYNRKTATLSPYQAYEIAVASRQLAGIMNGPGMMYRFRKSLGIDTLELRDSASAGGPSSLAAGKQVGPGLYIEVNSSLDQKSDAEMTAEYEISRHFSVETTAGPAIRPGIGVNWKTDY
jgi:autotransporter translocation and assembly factor TamB